MDNVNHIYRKQNRRIAERRRVSRRVIKHVFGSDVWQQTMATNYVFWPKHDRRIQERRTDKRRVAERRIGLTQSRRYSSRQGALRQNGHYQRLTAEERKMLDELNQR